MTILASTEEFIEPIKTSKLYITSDFTSFVVILSILHVKYNMIASVCYIEEIYIINIYTGKHHTWTALNGHTKHIVVKHVIHEQPLSDTQNTSI